MHEAAVIETKWVRRISAADLLIAALAPVTVVERHWEENEGEPDSLLVFLSNGRNFSLRFDPKSGRSVPDCFERQIEIDYQTVEDFIGHAALCDFERELSQRYAEQQSEDA